MTGAQAEKKSKFLDFRNKQAAGEPWTRTAKALLLQGNLNLKTKIFLEDGKRNFRNREVREM